MPKGVNVREKGEEYKRRRPEIEACLNRLAGDVNAASTELNIPVSSIRTLIKRWEDEKSDKQKQKDQPDQPDHSPAKKALRLQRNYTYAAFRSREELVSIFEKVLQQPGIEAARACWAGVKLAKGIM